MNLTQSDWQSIVAEHSPVIYRIAAARIADQSACDDIVQETFVAFLQSLSAFDPSKPIQNYLTKIASFKVADYLRAAYRRAKALAIAGEIAKAEASHDYTDDAASLAIAVAMLRDKYDRRGDNDRSTAIGMLFVDRLTVGDVARRLELPPAKVANWKFAAVAEIRRITSKDARHA